jgi:comEA protein
MQGTRAHEGMEKATAIIDSIILSEEHRIQHMLLADSLTDTIPSMLDKGIQIHFPKKSAKQPSIIDINRAGLQEFMQLPGIGQSTAEKILAYRTQQSFTDIEDIMNVKGIGEKKFEKMKPYLKVGLSKTKNR